jgi:hypothetical protein
MSVEGVFRKNGNIRRLKELSDALDRDLGGVNLMDENPVQLAALLKKFLRELPDPLLTYKLHHLFIATQRIESSTQRTRMLHLVTCLLPKAHRDTMEVVIIFLKWVAQFAVVDEETGSKMDAGNLATTIAPSVLLAKGSDASKDESFLAIGAVHQLLEQQDLFWQVPEEIAGILDDQAWLNAPDLSSKQLLKRCAEYAQRVSASRERGTTQRSPMRGAVTSQSPVYTDWSPQAGMPYARSTTAV